jgi:ribosomal protein L29
LHLKPHRKVLFYRTVVQRVLRPLDTLARPQFQLSAEALAAYSQLQNNHSEKELREAAAKLKTGLRENQRRKLVSQRQQEIASLKIKSKLGGCSLYLT